MLKIAKNPQKFPAPQVLGKERKELINDIVFKML